jgi:hypothetical protein
MRKKPKPALRLVDAGSADDTTVPPADLGEAGGKLWKSIMDEFRIDDAPGRQTLLQICHAADIADDAHARGMLKDELQARAFIARALRQMNFDVEPNRDTVGRPPAGWRR